MFHNKRTEVYLPGFYTSISGVFLITELHADLVRQRTDIKSILVFAGEVSRVASHITSLVGKTV